VAHRGTRRGQDRRRPALTLIDVVAALVLLAVVLPALFAAQGRALEQLAALRDRNHAATMIQEMLVQWELSQVDVTQPAEGIFPGAPDWTWSRTVQRQAVGADGELLRIRVVASRRDHPSGPGTTVAYEWLAPATAPTPPAPDRTRSAGDRRTRQGRRYAGLYAR
jgi:hypothetical protein